MVVRASLLGSLVLLAAACAGSAEEVAGAESPSTETRPTEGARTEVSEAAREGESAPGNAAPAPKRQLVVHSLANLGDSISQAFDADDSEPLDISKAANRSSDVFHDNPALSWVHGTDKRVSSVRSHYEAIDPKLVVTPLSRSGAELVGKNSGLPNFEKQARALASAKAKPDLVLVLLGGNDVCNRARSTTDDATANMYSVDEWRAAAVKGLDALAEVLEPNATVRVVSMPRVDMLYGALKDAEVPFTFDLGGQNVKSSGTCEHLWKVTAAQNGICKIVTTETSAEKRQAIGARIDAYNTALAEEVRKIAKDAARNPKKIAFESDWHGSLDEGGTKNASGGTFVYEPKHVSKLDCFHPSVEGQRSLAELVLETATFD